MKKYRTELKGKKIVLFEADWEKLRERFDTELAELNGGLYHLDSTCPLCRDFVSDGCRGCTFHKFEKMGTTSEGCTNAIEILLGTEAFEFNPSVGGLHWEECNDKKAREQLDKVYTALGKMKLR
jgi:hypothetical protein